MKTIMFALMSCVGIVSFAGTIPTGYVTDGLTAYWDAIDNQGSGVHDATATTWVDLVGQREFQLTGTTWDEKYLKFAGTSTSYGALTGETAIAVFDSNLTTSKRVTVELVFKYDDTLSDGVILQAHNAAKVSIGRMNYGGIFYYSTQSDWTGSVTVGDGFTTHDVPYVFANGLAWVIKGASYNNAKNIPFWNTRACTGANDTQVTIGMTTAGGSCFAGRLYAVRVYNRTLSAADVSQNYAADLLRYNYTPAGTVVSGSVKVGGATFAAGETILADPASATLSLDDATDATVSLDARITGLSHTNGTLAIANNASRTLARLENVTLGAAATLQLPSDGLYVTGILAAEAGATVQGPGTLIGAAAQAPSDLTLAAGATYLCATATSFAWPSSGIAYIPVGKTADVQAGDVAKISSLDKIVFLGNTSGMSYKLSDAWTLGVPLEGSGKVSFESAGAITLSGNNSRLTGSFFFTNTAVRVASRYGLGSAATGACTVHFGDQIDALRFSGAGLTNDVPLKVYQGTQNQNLVLGPENAGETLVLNGGFLVMNDANIQLYLRNRIRVGGGAFGIQTKKYQYVNALTDPVELVFDRGSTLRGDKLLFYGNIQMHVDWENPERIYFISLYVPSGASAAPSMTFYGDELLDLGYISGSGTLNLNGHDQTVPMISRQYGSPLQVTSVTPARLKVTQESTEDNCRRMNVCFSGAAGFDYSVPATITNELFDSYSPTTGPLTISKGALYVTGKAGWGGTNVTVCADARLIVASAAADHMFGDKAVLGYKTTTHLAVENGGILELEGGTATVRSYAYNGVCVPAGVYTSASGVGIEGPGVLRVRSNAPCEPGFLLLVR